MSTERKSNLRSVQQTQDAIIDTLRRATDPISAPEICRRTGISIELSRNTLATLVKHETVLVSATRPPLYRLPNRTVAGPRHVHKVRGNYRGEELGFNTAIDPARLEAFALPSRVGSQLHYPDGRVEVVA